MRLLVIRHGIAEEQETFARTGQPDTERPLTKEGRRKMAEVALGLHTLVPELDRIASSPLVRAQQTAEIVAKAYGMDAVETTDALVPLAKPALLARWAVPYAGSYVVAVVGHEPHLSTLVTWLLCGEDDSRIELKKGGACLLTCEGGPSRAGGVLLWLHTPASLRRLGA